MALDIGLLQGPRRKQFFMSEVPLQSRLVLVLPGFPAETAVEIHSDGYDVYHKNLDGPFPEFIPREFRWTVFHTSLDGLFHVPKSRGCQGVVRCAEESDFL